MEKTTFIPDKEKVLDYCLKQYLLTYVKDNNDTIVQTDSVVISDYKNFLNALWDTLSSRIIEHLEPTSQEIVENTNIKYAPKFYNIFIDTFKNAGYDIDYKILYKELGSRC